MSKKMTVGAALALTLVVMAATVPSAGATTSSFSTPATMAGTVLVQATVNAVASVSVLETGDLRVMANSPWTLRLETSHGEEIYQGRGEALIRTPDETVSYSVSID